jgi:hypothetical protein
VLNFVKCFFCICWEDHMFFCPCFCLYVVVHLWIFVVKIPSLNPWKETNLFMVHDLFECCWILCASVLLRIFASIFP